MTDQDYRKFAAEIVNELDGVLIHTGTRHAVSIAGNWAKGKSVDEKSIEAAREIAMKDSARCTEEPPDGRKHAAEAAWLLLTESIKEWMPEIIRCVAMAKAARFVHKNQPEPSMPTQVVFEYRRAAEQELLEDRLTKREAEG